MSRKKTGILRPYPVPVNMNGDEDEYVARKSHALRCSKAELFRQRTLKGGWQNELLKLREKQKHMPLEEFRRAPMERETDLR